MVSKLREHYTDVAFLINSFFYNTRKEESTLAVPFHVIAKNIEYKCTYLYQGNKLTGDSILPLFCAFPDHVNIYLKSGAKPFTCKGCENCNITK